MGCAISCITQWWSSFYQPEPSEIELLTQRVTALETRLAEVADIDVAEALDRILALRCRLTNLGELVRALAEAGRTQEGRLTNLERSASPAAPDPWYEGREQEIPASVLVNRRDTAWVDPRGP